MNKKNKKSTRGNTCVRVSTIYFGIFPNHVALDP